MNETKFSPFMGELEGVRYIGVDDLDIDLFESQYVVPEGMSYNSYLIEDEKIAIMDTADRRKADEWKANLTAALAGRKPDYLVATTWNPTTHPSSPTCSRLIPKCNSSAAHRP